MPALDFILRCFLLFSCSFMDLIILGGLASTGLRPMPALDFILHCFLIFYAVFKYFTLFFKYFTLFFNIYSCGFTDLTQFSRLVQVFSSGVQGFTQ